MMKYVSTRGFGAVEAGEAVMQGLAPDGGLFVPAEWPEFDWRGALSEDALETEAKLLEALMPGCTDAETVHRAYAGKFEGGELSPLVKAGKDWAMELYHGPTSAFKDVALTLLPHLMSRVRENAGEKRVNILTATSGDTGKAALEGFHDVEGTGILVFYPHGGVSEVQRLQMVTQEGGNVCVCAVRGNFDDCQRGVKQAFSALSGALPEGVSLSSANSINIGRLVPQITYYFSAYAQLCARGVISVGDEVNFTVPTGNFGDILAGWYAKKLGLPVGMLICASNANDVLCDFFRSGTYDRRRPFLRTTSPSMDILVSSNLERLLYEISGRDADWLRGSMEKLESEGVYELTEEMHAALLSEFAAYRADDEEAAAAIARLWKEERYLCDTHTAVAFDCAEKYRRESGDQREMVVLSTASPYKFPAAVLAALGEEEQGDDFAKMARLHELTGVDVPPMLASLRERPQLHHSVIDVAEIGDFVKKWIEEGAVC